MPCYEVNTMSVEFKADHVDLLEQALDVLGWVRDWNVAKTFCRASNGIELDLRTGKAEIRDGQGGLLNELKRAYSQQVIKKVAQKNHWTVNWKTSTKAKGSFIKTWM